MFYAKLIVSLFLFGCVCAYQEGDRFFYFPDGEGNIHLIDAEEPVELNLPSEPAAFWLYTRANPTTRQILTDAASVLSSNFDPARETKIIVHGWTMNGGDVMNLEMTEAFLAHADYNIISVDYSEIAAKNYISAVLGVPSVGQAIGGMMTVLNSVGASYGRMHLIGMSLGGHVIGHAGRAVGGQVQRITSLDPAGPLWTSRGSRLRDTDGIFVEVIHTNAGDFGYVDPIGDVDFYPNGGRVQSGCGLNMLCSHARAYIIYIESIGTKDFVGRRCANAAFAKLGLCYGSKLYMGGEDVTKSGKGVYHLTTNDVHPFARGG